MTKTFTSCILLSCSDQ